MGHLCGIFAALIIKFCGIVYIPLLLPKYEWINEFDSKFAQKIESKVSYFKAT
jgi:hypothetical protein